MPEYRVEITRRYTVTEVRTIPASSPETATKVARQMLAEDEFFEFPDNLYYDGDEVKVTRR